MDYDVEVRQLSSAFYSAYPPSKYPELLRKGKRPYSCLVIDTHEDYLICVPFRSNINHSKSFRFSGTQRSAASPSGLDYKKIVLIKDSNYIDASPAVVDTDEYKDMMKNIQSIIVDVDKYITGYTEHILGNTVLHRREYERRYKYSTLPYFHDILGLPI